MKIIYNIRSFANTAGMERILSNKANWLVCHGHEVVLITTDQNGQPNAFDLDSRIKRIDLGINYRNKVSSKESLAHHRQLLEAVLNSEKADICISLFCEDVNFLYKINDGSKKVVEYHFCKEKNINRSILRSVAHRYKSFRMDQLVRKYDKLVVLTDQDAESWRCGNICIIPNSVSFPIVNKSLLAKNTVLAVGRYSYQKGFDMLLDAWRKIPEQFIKDGWNLRIVGRGECHDSYNRIVAEHGMADSVVLGPADVDMSNYYLDSSIMAMTSRYEGLPLALAEAQTFGVPAVAFDCNCGPRDIIEDGVSGYLIPLGDIDLFAQRLATLMQDEDLRRRMGKAAYEQAARFNTETVMAKWVKLFEELVDKS